MIDPYRTRKRGKRPTSRATRGDWVRVRVLGPVRWHVRKRVRALQKAEALGAIVTVWAVFTILPMVAAAGSTVTAEEYTSIDVLTHTSMVGCVGNSIFLATAMVVFGLVEGKRALARWGEDDDLLEP